MKIKTTLKHILQEIKVHNTLMFKIPTSTTGIRMFILRIRSQIKAQLQQLQTKKFLPMGPHRSQIIMHILKKLSITMEGEIDKLQMINI